MRRHPITLAIAILCVAAMTSGPLLARGGNPPPPPPEPNVPSALIVDPCRTKTVAADSVTSEVTAVDVPSLQEAVWWPHATDDHGGATWASLPGYEHSHVFLTRGGKVEVYNLGLENDVANEEDPDGDFNYPIRTVNIAGMTGIAGLRLGRMATGRWLAVPVGDPPGAAVGQASLYLIGNVDATDKAYYVVIDQQYLIEGSAPSGTVIYGAGEICAVAGTCTTRDDGLGHNPAIDIALDPLGTGTYAEAAYITVAESDGSDQQVVYRLDRDYDSNFSVVEVLTDSWNPTVPDAAGLAAAPGSHDVYATLKSARVVRNMADGTQSCILSGEPTDVAVWEPGSASIEPRYLFATTWNDPVGRVEVFPAGSCQGPAVLTIDVRDEPSSLDIHVDGNSKVWVIVASKAGYVEAFHVQLDVVGDEDQFTLLTAESVEYDMTAGWFVDSCPINVDVGERAPLVDSFLPKKLGMDRNCLPGDLRCGGL